MKLSAWISAGAILSSAFAVEAVALGADPEWGSNMGLPELVMPDGSWEEAKQGRGRGRGRGGDSDSRSSDDDDDDTSGSGRDEPRIPGGSGCDDPGDILEHPECSGEIVDVNENGIDDREETSGSGRSRPRIPGGSGCDDPEDLVEHPECLG